MIAATRKQWEAFARLNLPDLLPIPADRDIPIGPKCNLTVAVIGKAPGRIYTNGQGHECIGALLGWQDRETVNVDDWIDDRRYNIGMVCRRLKAIDVDVTDPALASTIEAAIWAELGVELPRRCRGDSSKFALFYRLDGSEPLAKDSIVLADEHKIEFMGDRQQMVVAGQHPDGDHYEWPAGIPESLEAVPLLTFDDLNGLYDMLQAYRRPGTPITRANWALRHIETEAKSRDEMAVDPVVQYLEQFWDVHGYAPHKGAVFVRCPHESQHTTPTKPDGACYFLPSADQPKGGFKCLHESHGPISLDMFLDAVGYRTLEIDNEFEVVEKPERAPRPKMIYTKIGQIKACEANYTALLGWHDGFGYDIRYDTFKDAQVYRDVRTTTWQPFKDETYTLLRLLAIERGMEDNIHLQKWKQNVDLVARRNAVDTAQRWLGAQSWDGTPRIDTFPQYCWQVADTAYHRAVSRYLWTALAGRVMEPGVKADMVPILSGPQGTRKSTFVEYLAPTPDEFTAVSLDERDADLSRRLRGKLVIEWDELRGLHTRELEAIKAWVTRRKEDWIPKYREFGTSLLRRFVIVGTTNHRRFLSDPTGYRRWLPVYIDRTIDTDYLDRHREQLWAEARELFATEGLLWQDAEHLAKHEFHRAVMKDIWHDSIEAWVAGKEGFATSEVLVNACNMPLSRAMLFHKDRVARVLADLGYLEHNGRWFCELA